jgi:hypothetical protein
MLVSTAAILQCIHDADNEAPDPDERRAPFLHSASLLNRDGRMCPVIPQGVRKGLNISFTAAVLRDPPETNRMSTEKKEGGFLQKIRSHLFRPMTRAKIASFLGIKNSPTVAPVPSSNGPYLASETMTTLTALSTPRALTSRRRRSQDSFKPRALTRRRARSQDSFRRSWSQDSFKPRALTRRRARSQDSFEPRTLTRRRARSQDSFKPRALTRRTMSAPQPPQSLRSPSPHHPRRRAESVVRHRRNSRSDSRPTTPGEIDEKWAMNP